mmetsp:Transcript_64654/g.140804  ORF Transcript_64654/g.140804 Transcript_64654/m.140804 type:complete len:729 (+) Transcript_64654:136-2322(+)
MTVFDDVNSGALFVNSFFSWSTYNRDAYAQNVAMRQLQKYQEKNYKLDWTTVARDDVRAMMGISVTRINNYMIVATLILTLAGRVIMSTAFAEGVEDYIIHAFYINASIAMVFLMVTIMYCVKGQNSAFTNTMKLLTFRIRPENPAEYNHNYMTQAQHIEMLGPQALLRIPGFRPWAGAEAAAAAAAGPAEEARPVENLHVGSSYLWYLAKFRQFMNLWLPYDTFAKYSMGLAIISLGQASAYFALGQIDSHGHYNLSYLMACLVTTSFIYMIGIVTVQNFSPQNLSKLVSVLLLVLLPPVFCAIAANTDDVVVEKVCVTANVVGHLVFWIMCLMLASGNLSSLRREHTEHWEAGDSTVDSTANLGDDKSNEMRREETREFIGDWQGLGPPASKPSNGLRARTIGAGVEGGMGPPQHKEGHLGGQNEDHWPTDDIHFVDKVWKLRRRTRSTVKCTISLGVLVWTMMLGWVIHKYVFGVAGPVRIEHRVASVTEEFTIGMWPSLFRPHALACSSGQVFLADRSHVYEVNASVLNRVACEVNGTIVDVIADCDGAGGCRPLVLVSGMAGAASHLVNCSAGIAQPLLQDSLQTEQLALGVSGAAVRFLMAARGGDLMRYRWDGPFRDGWAPQFFIRSVAGRSLKSLAVAQAARDGSHRMLLFYGTGAEAAVEARDVATMNRRGSWNLPPDFPPLVAGCALGTGGSALALASASLGTLGTPIPRLLQLSLPP